MLTKYFSNLFLSRLNLQAFKKRMTKQEQLSEKVERRKSRDYKPSMMESLRSRIVGGSMSNLNVGVPEKRNTYSSLVSGGSVTSKSTMSSVQKKILEKKFIRTAQNEDDEFKVSVIS